MFNQTPPLTDYNLFTTDLALQEAVRREGAGAAVPDLASAGAALGTAANFEHARLANRYPPVLHGFNVQGERIDSIEFHPSWHVLMQGIAARGYHTGPWVRVDGRADSRRTRGASRGLPDAGAGGMRHALPDHHDLRRGRGDAPRRVAGPGLGAAARSRATTTRATSPSNTSAAV